MFTKTANGWHLTVELWPDTRVNDLFGCSVATRSGAVVVGDDFNGKVYVFNG